LFLPVALLSSTRKNFSIMCSIITKKCKKSEQTDSLLHRILYCKKKKKYLTRLKSYIQCCTLYDFYIYSPRNLRTSLSACPNKSTYKYYRNSRKIEFETKMNTDHFTPSRPRTQSYWLPLLLFS
jgi:hypothetical protein